MTRTLVSTVLVTLAVVAIFALWAWVASANAAAPLQPLRHADVRLEVGPGRSAVFSKRPVPGKYKVYVDVSFNGKTAEMIWSDSRWDVAYAWHGVIVVVGAAKKRAPFFVRAASVRNDVVQVYVRLSWVSA